MTATLTEKDLAKRWGITTRTLQGWRATWDDQDAPKKLGPRFVRIGRRSIYYRLADVEDYEAACVVGNPPAPAGWDSTVKRAAGALDVLAEQAKTPKAKQTLTNLRDELRGLLE